MKTSSYRPFTLFCLLGVLSLLKMGCSCEPASSTMAATYLELDLGYLGLCNSFYGNVANAEIEVNIDGMNEDGDPVMMDTQFFEANNDDLALENLLFPIAVPLSGTFVVSVSIRLDCHECCSIDCAFDEFGKPRFRGTSLTINAEPPPSSIRVSPVFQTCLCSCY